MNTSDLPPFPGIGEKGAQVCARVRFYLAIVDELPPARVHLLSEHLKGCAQCAAEFQLVHQATRLVASLPESTPSAQVDAAMMAALHQQQRALSSAGRARARPAGRSARRAWVLAAAAVMMIAAGLLTYGLIAGRGASFRLPAGLSWNGYVLHYIQTRNDARGQAYQVEVYQDLGTNDMHIESNLPGQFDVVVVTERSTMLGKDMMHHIAQMGDGVAGWATDGSLFDLDQLRHDLAAGNAVYMGRETFQGQEVYQVRLANGQILLLSMHYLPVNALHTPRRPGTGVPIYQTCQVLLSAQVSASLWDMQVPADFQMGQLPARS